MRYDRKIVDVNCTIKSQPELNCVHAYMEVYAVHACACVYVLRSTDWGAIQMQSVYCLFVCGFLCVLIFDFANWIAPFDLNERHARSHQFRDKNREEKKWAIKEKLNTTKNLEGKKPCLCSLINNSSFLRFQVFLWPKNHIYNKPRKCRFEYVHVENK